MDSNPPRHGVPASPPDGPNPFDSPDLPPPYDDDTPPPTIPSAAMAPVDVDDLAPRRLNFPVCCLPPSIAAYVAASARSIGVDPSMVGVPILSALAACIGTARRFHAGGTWSDPAALWTATIARSGRGKSPGQAAALRFVREIQSDYIRAYRQASEEHRQAVAEAKSRKRGQGDPIVGDAPQMQILKTNNATTEAIARLIENNPRGILIEREEIAGIFNACGQYKSGRGCDTEDIIELHDGKQLIASRKGEGSVAVDCAVASICGGIQPQIIRKLLQHDDGKFITDGLAARLLLSMPPDVPPGFDPRPFPDDVVESARRVFMGLLDLMPTVPPGATPPPPPEIPLSPSALTAFLEFRKRLQRAESRHDSESAISRVYAKIIGYALRLAGILHLARSADPLDDRHDDPQVISVGSMAEGIALATWFLREAERVYCHFRQAAVVQRNPNDPVALVSKSITEAGGRIRVNGLFNRFRRNRAFNWHSAEAARTWLTEHYVASGRAMFDRVGKSDWLVLVDPPDPFSEEEDDDEPMDSVAIDDGTQGGVDSMLPPETDTPSVKGPTFPSTPAPPLIGRTVKQSDGRMIPVIPASAFAGAPPYNGPLIPPRQRPASP